MPLKRHWLLVEILNENFKMWDKIGYHQDLDQQIQGAAGPKGSAVAREGLERLTRTLGRLLPTL